MIELAYPVIAFICVFAVLIPALSVLAAFALKHLHLSDRHPQLRGSWLNYALIVTPVAVPVISLTIALVHRFDGHHVAQACHAVHEAGKACVESPLLATFLLIPTLAALAYRFRPARRRGELHQDWTRQAGVPVRVVAGNSVCTRGFVRPWIEIGEELATELDAIEFESVLLHEAAHATSFDPFFATLGSAALLINPASVLLQRHFDAWLLGREIRCDLWSLTRGADRFALAEALLKVVRMDSPIPAGASALTGAAAALHLRVAVLLSPEPPKPIDQRIGAAITALGFLAIVAVSIQCELTMLDQFHHAVEHLFTEPHHHGL